MPKTGNNMKKIKGPFEKYNLFEKMDINDHCWKVDGVKVGGPGVVCWMFIFLIIFQFIISLFMIPKYREWGLTDIQIFVRYFFQLLFMVLVSTFMYSMCKRCRGLQGLLIFILLQFIAGLIALGPFFAKVQKNVKSLKSTGKVVEGNTCSKSPKTKIS